MNEPQQEKLSLYSEIDRLVKVITELRQECKNLDDTLRPLKFNSPQLGYAQSLGKSASIDTKERDNYISLIRECISDINAINTGLVNLRNSLTI